MDKEPERLQIIIELSKVSAHAEYIEKNIYNKVLIEAVSRLIPTNWNDYLFSELYFAKCKRIIENLKLRNDLYNNPDVWMFNDIEFQKN